MWIWIWKDKKLNSISVVVEHGHWKHFCRLRSQLTKYTRKLLLLCGHLRNLLDTELKKPMTIKQSFSLLKPQADFSYGYVSTKVDTIFRLDMYISMDVDTDVASDVDFELEIYINIAIHVRIKISSKASVRYGCRYGYRHRYYYML